MGQYYFGGNTNPDFMLRLGVGPSLNYRVCDLVSTADGPNTSGSVTRGTSAAMGKYRRGGVTDEDDLTGIQVGRLDAAFDSPDAKHLGGIKWSSSILRHRRGIASQERSVGADLLIHVSLDTPALKYSKGALVQAKRVEPDDLLSNAEHNSLLAQSVRRVRREWLRPQPDLTWLIVCATTGVGPKMAIGTAFASSP